MGYQFSKAEKKNSNKAIFFTIFIHVILIGGIVLHTTGFNPASLLPATKENPEQKEETPKAKKEKTAELSPLATPKKKAASPIVKKTALSERAKYRSLEKKADKARRLLKKKKP